MKHLITNSADGKPSGSKTAYMIMFAICAFKVLTSDFAGFGIAFGPADYSGLAMLLAAAGATYWGRAKTKSNMESDAE